MTEDSTPTDISNRDDIAHLVTEFYRWAFADSLLGPIFTDVAQMDLEAHMPVMCDFWETVLFQAGLYRGNAFTVHLTLHQQEPLTPTHFQRWLDLWENTVDSLFTGPTATLAKVQAGRIAGGISRRLERPMDGEGMPLQAASADHRTRSAVNERSST